MNRSFILSVFVAFALSVSPIKLIDGGVVKADDLTTVNENLLPSADEIQEWHVQKDKGGPTHSGRDRKRTRLNSSHKPISYAVFCLKKKK